MAIEKISIERFIFLSKTHPVFDVRSPAEFLHAHIPRAYSLPLFDDEQRKVIGTIYKQQSRQQAIKTGLDYFGVKMKKIVEDVERIVAQCLSTDTANGDPITGNILPANNKTLLIHCWRGGMRSSAVAWLLDLYGYKVHTLSGGYKAFRNWCLQQFDKPYNFKVLGGYTGSGKTVLIKELGRLGYPVIDLESLANHKGSAFGYLGEKQQPSQEMFENLLALELFSRISAANQELEEIWIEDESQRIGRLIIPAILWDKMRNSPVYFIDIPFEERLKHLTQTYGVFEKAQLTEAISRIQKRLGGLETTNAINFILENNFEGGFSILLKYYDKCYIKGLFNRKNVDSLLNKIPCINVNTSNISSLPLLQNIFK